MGEWTKERHEAAKLWRKEGRSLYPETQDKALAEIERGWAEIERLAAPVDVEKEVERVAGEMYDRFAEVFCGVTIDRSKDCARDAVRPLVTDRARLAREVEAAGVERDTAWEAHAAVAAELAKARAETKEVYAELETVRAKNISAVGALVEIRETLGRAQTERDVARTEIARLTAAPGQAWAMVRKAVDGWENGVLCKGDVIGMLRDALAAVEPRVDAVTADPSAPVEPGYVGPGGCDACGNAPGERHAVMCEGAAREPTASAPGASMTRAELDVEIDRLHAKRAKARRDGVPFDRARLDALQREAADRIPIPTLAPGQIGPLCVDCSTGSETQHTHTEARPTGRCDVCGNGGIMYAPPGWTASPAEVTDAELAEVVRTGACFADVATAPAWCMKPDVIAYRLARTEQARRAAPASDDVARLRAILVAAPYLDAQQTAAVREIVARLNMPTPPRALTEAEARAWSKALGAKCATLRFDSTEEVALALLAASRGDVPPEVRPVPTGRLAFEREVKQATMAGAAAGLRRIRERMEMAVTTGEDVEQWAPKPGARTMTAPFVVRAERRAAAGEIIRQCGERDFVVMHDDGTQAHYDADELGPAPAEKSGLCDEPAPRIAPREVRYQAVMKHHGLIAAGLGRDETDPPPAVPSIAGPAGLDVARKAGGGQ